MAILERISDRYGAAIIGWLLPRVLYARFERTISADVGVRLARRFSSLIGDTAELRYFADSSGVAAYDVMALRVVMDAMLSKREQLTQIVVRPWAAALGARAAALPGQFEAMSYVASASEFDAQLAAAGVVLQGSTTLVDVGLARDAEIGDAPELTAPAFSLALRGVVYSYAFDLSDFERGAFTARRFAFLSTRPFGAWLCVARSDDQALALARQAARCEWARPWTRRPEQFTVRFLTHSDDMPERRVGEAG